MDTLEKRSHNRAPTWVDEHVARRMRARRLQLGLSQEDLANGLGITFQQVQKYEKGHNRMGAGRLHKVAQILEVPIQHFFDDLPSDAVVQASGAKGAAHPVLSTSEVERVVAAYSAISDESMREALLNMMRTIGRSTSPVAAL